jgi:hypothetical protein
LRNYFYHIAERARTLVFLKPKSIFVLKSLTVSIKSRTFAATVPATPPSNAYHGGTSSFYKSLMAAWTEMTSKTIKMTQDLENFPQNNYSFGKFY